MFINKHHSLQDTISKGDNTAKTVACNSDEGVARGK